MLNDLSCDPSIEYVYILLSLRVEICECNPQPSQDAPLMILTLNPDLARQLPFDRLQSPNANL